MRKTFVCLACATHYIPPESMRYESLDMDASPVHCANPHCKTALLSGHVAAGVPLEILERWALRAAERQPDPQIPRVARARGRRPAGAPASARSKLR